MHTIYSKFTDYRRARFRLMTSIREGSSGKTVVKKNAPGGDAQQHLERIAYNRTLLEPLYAGMLSVCPYKWVGNSLVFPFIEGTSYLDRLREAGTAGGLSGFLSCLQDYLHLLDGGQAQVPFFYTEAFQLVFGRVAGLEGAPSLALSNLDASPGNIIEDSEKRLHLIDYEWVFDFPIPLDFILFRHLRFLYAEQGFDCLAGLTFGDLLDACGVQMNLGTLNAMYDGFQQYVCVEDNAELSCAQIFERHRKTMHEGGDGQFRRPPHFVFLDKGEGFNEQEKLVFPAEDGEVDLTLDVAGVRAIRFDPFEGQQTLTENLAFTAEDGTALSYSVPSSTASGADLILNNPANATVAIPPGTVKLHISGFLLFMSERDAFWMGRLQATENRVAALEQTLSAERASWEAERASLHAENAASREQQSLELRAREIQLTQAAEQLEREAAARRAFEEQSAVQLAAAQQDAAQLREHLRALQNTRSWRATAWLRKLRSLGRHSQ